MTLVLSALIMVAAVTISLRARGRPWYRNQYSQRVVDAWAITHVGHGIVLYGLLRCLLDWQPYELLSLVVISESLWESLENRNWTIRLFRRGGDKHYWGDSVANSGADLLACLAGAVVTSFFVG
jgi:hypothetical protein